VGRWAKFLSPIVKLSSAGEKKEEKKGKIKGE
jgi:hypothetical protein